MTESHIPDLAFAPFVTNTGEENVFVTSEGGGRPINGRVPVFPFEFSTWQEEELTWHDSCYIHAGLNPFVWGDVKGADFIKLLNDLCITTYNNFPVGKARHCILCNDEGKITMDGIVVRRAEDEFITMCLPDFVEVNEAMGSPYDIEGAWCWDKYFFYQLCGPRSLEVVEAATRSDLHDIKFMWTKDAKIAGKDVFILRTGMAGTLGYEVHGKAEDALEVYEAILAAGEPFGIQPIGRHAYRNTHTEGSIPQASIHFSFGVDMLASDVVGSFGADCPYKFLSPIDCGWEKMISFNHEFPGKAALEAEISGHHNTLVHLIWNAEDCAKVIAASMDKDLRVDMMPLAEDFNLVRSSREIHIDQVLDGDKVVGGASGRMFSPKNYEMMSLAVIDEDYAVEGKKVEVLWGRPGTTQMRIRAVVTLAPYIKECRNDTFDVEQIPHPVF